MNREDQEFKETLELLREAHREPILEAHFAAVRARVLAQLAAQRRPWWQGIRAYGFAAAAVAAILVAAFIVGRAPWSARVPLHQPFARAERPTGASAADQGVRPTNDVGAGHARPAPVAHIRRRHSVGAVAAYRAIGPPNPQPLVVKLVTNDPNVVIYWISGE
jgi:hypothetical protein